MLKFGLAGLVMVAGVGGFVLLCEAIAVTWMVRMLRRYGIG